MIRDQRTMLDGYPHLTTVDHVRLAWACIAMQRGVALHDSPDTTTAYVSHGRWVADCPNPLCCDEGANAEAAWPENPHWACLRCGVVCAVEFPAPAVIAGADSILHRRKVAHRNWDPRRESLLDLQCENLIDGPLPRDFAGMVMDGRRLGPGDVLPQFQPGPRALAAGRRS